ncbi:hypothetical protein FNPHOIGM_00001 [Dickeya phage DchS19]|uniref:Uncharacterized protein n=1 Tax=Dickeya phage DchS19 TaxID=2951194 RepID=A0A9E7LUK0_9CAUD|nr:hypothetical protein FNPHOIGM_00001 [Dickeya phage DchS19]
MDILHVTTDRILFAIQTEHTNASPGEDHLILLDAIAVDDVHQRFTPEVTSTARDNLREHCRRPLLETFSLRGERIDLRFGLLRVT